MFVKVAARLLSGCAVTIAICIPASAIASPKPRVLVKACHDPIACVRITNGGSGAGLRVSATSNSGSVGATLFALGTDPGIGVGIGGVLGLDLSGNATSADYSAGVFGYSKYGEGVLAVSPFAEGAVGVTGNNGTQSGFGTSGIVGLDVAPDKSGFNNGVSGQSQFGYGVFGIGTSASATVASVGVAGTTLVGSKSSPIPGGVVGIGVLGTDASSDGGLRNVGVLGLSNGVGVVAIGAAPAQSPGYATRPALRARCLNDGDAITGVSKQTEIFNFDCRGNLVLAGGITTRGAMQVATVIKGGTSVLAFAARTTRATLEDVGSATLVSGAARVAFDPAFANAIDNHIPYLVFVTANGDSRGLYVQKNATGFVVRENSAGRSTLDFDYRVVAKPLDAPATRLAAARTITTLSIEDASDDAAISRARLMLHVPRSR